jgi:hypothetical protein
MFASVGEAHEKVRIRVSEPRLGFCTTAVHPELPVPGASAGVRVIRDRLGAPTPS